VPLQQLSFHPCMHWKGLRLLFSLRAQETSCCTNFNSLCSELHLVTLLLLAPVVSLQYLVGSYGYSTQSPCALVQFLLSRFLPIPCLCLTAAHPVTTPVQVKNRVPIFIPLLYFSSIIRVFINSPFEKSQSPNLTSLEKSSLYQILDHTEPNCSFVPSSC